MNFFTYRPLTEIEFLSRQTMIFATGRRTSIGTLATITPADGLTFVLLGAQIAPLNVGVTSALEDYDVELRNEANVRCILGAATSIDASFDSSNTLSGQNVSFVRGDVLVGDGIKTYTLELVTLTTGILIAGSIWGYTRNT